MIQRNSHPKASFPKILGKEAIKETAEVTHQRLARVGGWGAAGRKRTILNAIKKSIQQLTK